MVMTSNKKVGARENYHLFQTLAFLCDLVIFGIQVPIILPVKKPKTSLFQTARVAQPIELSKVRRQFCTDK